MRQFFFKLLLLLLLAHQDANAQNCTITSLGSDFNLQCNDNGTANDANDDYMTFSLNPTGTNLGTGYSVLVGSNLSPITLLDGGSASNVPYGLATSFRTPNGTATISGTISARDISTNCSLSQSFTATGPCSTNAPPPCDLTATGFSGLVCNNNGTPNTSVDDYMVFSLNPTGTNLGAGYDVLESAVFQQLQLENGNSFSVLPYGSTTTFRTPNGTANFNGSLVIRDASFNTCTINQSITATGNCSIQLPPCDLTSIGFDNLACNDNGTPTNPSDDYMVFSLSPVGVNLGATYKVLSNANLSPIQLLNGSPAINISYNNSAFFRTPNGTANISGSVVVADEQDNSCQILQNIVATGVCSGPCEFTTTDLDNTTCNDNGTPSDPSDDYLEFQVNPQGFNFNSGYQFDALPDFPAPTNLDGSIALNIPYGSFNTFRTANGTANGINGEYRILIVDDSGDCSIEDSMQAPGTCSSSIVPCDITSATTDNTSGCNDNNTSIDTDDFFTTDITVHFNNPPTTGKLSVFASGDVLEQQSFAAANLVGGTHVFQDVKLRANGSVTIFTVGFTADEDCFLEGEGPAVVSCSVVPTLLSCPEDITVDCATEVPLPDPDDLNIDAFCDGGDDIIIEHLSDVISNQTCGNRFTIIRTYQATGDCIEPTTCSQTITVFDGILPVITTPPANITVECGSNTETELQNWFDTAGGAVAEDNCGGSVTWTHSTPAVELGCGNTKTISVFFFRSDDCQNPDVDGVLAFFTITDSKPPIITCPAASSVVCASQVPVPDVNLVTATDLCGGDITTVFFNDETTNLTCANRFTVTRTYRATDECNNSATCSQVIVVNDQTAPSLTCPAGATVSCVENLPIRSNNSVTGVSDNCGGTAPTVSFVSDVITNQTCINRFTQTRTYRATDVCGNSATCSQVIVVNDQTAPSLTCPAGTTVSCVENLPIRSNNSVTGVSDNCGGTAPTVSFVSDVITNQTCINRFTQTRTYRATDACGNSATCSQVIVVNDQTAPVFTAFPANETVDCYLVPPVGSPIATDNCNGVVVITYLGEVSTPGICPTIFSLTRTWEATDICGNRVTASQVITVTDNKAPNFKTDPQDVIAECNSGNMDDFQTWILDNGGAEVEDCTDISWSINDSPLHVCPTTCGNTFQKWIRFTATDECGNATYRDASFIVVDSKPPVFTVPPQDKTISCMEGCNGEVDFYDWFDSRAGLVVEDNCGSVTLEIGGYETQNGCGRTWQKKYEFRATDECGNVSKAYATFRVIDNMAPVITTCPASNWTLTCVEDLPSPDPSAVVATDECGTVSVTLQDVQKWGTGCANTPMIVAYTYAATDECGNITTCMQDFQIKDTAVLAINIPSTIEVACVDDIPGINAVANYLENLGAAACEVLTYKVLEDKGFNQGVHTYTVQAKDACLNQSAVHSVAFVVTGNCRPLCSAPNDIWGATGGFIGDNSVRQVLDSVQLFYGGVKVGSWGHTLTFSSTDCFLDLVGPNGDCSLIPAGLHVADDDLDCVLPLALLDDQGTLRSELITNALALQLNIWYNHHFNNRNLGVQDLRDLPECMIEPPVLKQLGSQSTWQDLLDLSNEYLGTSNAQVYPEHFGALLNAAMSYVNDLHLNCTTIFPCQDANVRIANRSGNQAEQENMAHLAPNPASDLINLTYVSKADGDLQVNIMNTVGIMETLHFKIMKGVNEESISIQHLPAGIYFVSLKQGDTLETLRLVKIEN